jgi:ElaB/YqjD/DUF883 family membrane-anchored ribosome-binding protein
MAQQLSDKVAQEIMGEIDTVTKRIDKQIEQINNLEPRIFKSLEQISQVTNNVLNQTRKVADQVILQSVNESHAKLADAIKTTAVKVADATAQRSAARWVSIAVSVSIGSLLLIGFTAYFVGKKTGEKIGYARTVDEKIAVAWSNTPNGILAKKLSDAGSIKHLTECDQPGWTITKKENGKYCYPDPSTEGLYGWRIEVK